MMQSNNHGKDRFMLSKSSYLRITAFCIAVFILAFSATAMAQHEPQKVYTVYAIADLHTTFSSTFHLPVFGVFNQDLQYVDELRPNNHSGGPIGLAVDPIHSKLFVTYEDSNKVDVFDARTAEQLTQVRLAGTSDLCGIDVLPSKNQFFVVDRGEAWVTVFDTDTYAQISQWFFGASVGAYGIDVVENVEGHDAIFVADGTAIVSWYDINTHLQIDDAEFSGNAIAVAVDNSGPAPVIFTTAVDPNHESDFSEPHSFLQKFDVATGIETRVQLPASGVGLAINEYEKLAYITIGSLGASDPAILIYNTQSMTRVGSIPLDFCSGSCTPTDVVSTEVAFGSRLKKELTSHANSNVNTGDTVSFTITYTNESTSTITSVALVDTYNTAQLSFMSADPAPRGDTDAGKLNWQNLTNTFDKDLAPQESFTIDVHFKAKEVSCEGTWMGVNVAETSDVRLESGLMLPSEQSKALYEINCVPYEDDAPVPSDDDTEEPEQGGDKDLWPDGKVTGGCCNC
jgi:uncharacterized repeat protein (TIGR01451 family)